MESKAQIGLHVGQRLTVDIEKIAHGGHFIARHESENGKKAVIFVRHAIPGEKVEIEITSTSSNFIRADVDRKSTRLNSSHITISYAVFCLKKKKNRKS